MSEQDNTEQTEEQVGYAYVVDPTVQPPPDGVPRTHEQLNADGSRELYTFEFRKPQRVPLPHALRFLQNDFKVFADEQMTRPLRQMRSAKEGHDGQAMRPLGNDEIVANLDELTQDALYARAAALPGGDVFKPKVSKKADMIAFVVDYNKRNAAARQRVEVDDLPEGGGMSPAEVAEHNREFAA